MRGEGENDCVEVPVGIQLQRWGMERYAGNERNKDVRRVTERGVVGSMDGGSRES